MSLNKKIVYIIFNAKKLFVYIVHNICKFLTQL